MDRFKISDAAHKKWTDAIGRIISIQYDWYNIEFVLGIVVHGSAKSKQNATIIKEEQPMVSETSGKFNNLSCFFCSSDTLSLFWSATLSDEISAAMKILNDNDWSKIIGFCSKNKIVHSY